MSTGRVYFQNGPLMSCYSYNFACTNQQTVEIRRSSLIPLQTTRQSLGQRPCSINEVSKLHFLSCTFNVSSNSFLRYKYHGKARKRTSSCNCMKQPQPIYPCCACLTHNITQHKAQQAGLPRLSSRMECCFESKPWPVSQIWPYHQSWHLQSLSRRVTNMSALRWTNPSCSYSKPKALKIQTLVQPTSSAHFAGKTRTSASYSK